MLKQLLLHNQTYVTKYNILKGLEDGGILLLNTNWTDEEIEHNFFWDCIIAFSFNNIIDIYDDIMGRDEFHLLCNYVDEYCDKNLKKANNEFEKNMIWNNLIYFSQKVREKDII